MERSAFERDFPHTQMRSPGKNLFRLLAVHRVRLLAFFLLFCLLFGGNWSGFLSWPFSGKFGVRQARAAVALVQSNTAVTGGNGGTSLSATFGSAPAAGNLLIAVVGAPRNTSITGPSGWSVAINEASTTSQGIFYKVAEAGEPTGVSVSTGGSGHIGIQIFEYSGLEPTSPFESAVSNQGTSSTVSTGNLTTTQPDVLLFAAATIYGQTSFSGWTNSFTERADNANGTGSSQRGAYGSADRTVTSAGTYSVSATAGVSGSFRAQLAAFRADIQFEQSAYRWFGNSDSAGVGSPLAAQNQPASVSNAGDLVRLRMLIHVSSSAMHASGRTFKLQFVGRGTGTCASPSGGSPAAYTDVATSTGVIRFHDNASVADGAALTATSTDPTHSGHTVVNQTYEEANNFTNSQGAISAGQDGKWDFALVNSSGQGGQTYCFRAVESDGTVLNLYGQYPQLIVGNLDPTIDNLALNGNFDIALTEGTSTLVQASATVSDPNGFTDIRSVEAAIFRTSLGESCTANDNNCYRIATSSCALSSCADTSCVATCSARVWFHAQPTDPGTPWESDSWSAWMRVLDASNASTTATSTGVDMLTLLGLAVTPSINYGTLGVGSTTDPLTRLVTVTSTGNASMDVSVFGANMTSGSNTISINEQRYATSSAAFAGATVATSSPGDLVDLNIPKPTTRTSTAASASLFWGLHVPFFTASGNYTGANSFIGAVNALPWP